MPTSGDIATQPMTFDTLVVGKGLIGSATAKHLSLSQTRLAIVGPDEPAEGDRPLVYASHYDSGRVQRLLGHNDAMTDLNLRSANHYPWLERESGIRFHCGVGCLYVHPEGIDDYLAAAPAKTANLGIRATFYRNQQELASAFPDFRFPPAAQGLFEGAPSGYLNPRQLLRAQLRVFEKNGGSIFRETVTGIEVAADWVTVRTNTSATFRAKKVVIAAGAFSNFNTLLDRRLDLAAKSETIILARVGGAEVARLAGLPSLLYEVDVPELEGIYATPPLQYPDGQYYLKLGCNLPEDVYFGKDLEPVRRWFVEGDSDRHAPKMLAALRTLIPTLAVDGWVTKRCLLPRTTGHGNPYLGQVNDRVYLAAGNGWSAMCSDGAGQLMAGLVTSGRFPEGINPEDFEPLFAP